MTNDSASPTPVAFVAASTWPDLREAVMDYLSETWHPDFTCPQVFSLAGDDDAPATRAAKWVARISAQKGVVAPLIQPGDHSAPTNDRCMHRIGVTQLLLDPDPAQVDQLYAMGLWTRLAGRRRRLWMRFSPQLSTDIAINAGESNPVMTLQVGNWRGVRFAIVSRNLIGAEVTARAFRTVVEPAGSSGLSPWQEPIVQAGIEQHLGARSGSSLEVVEICRLSADHPDRGALEDALIQTAALIDTSVSTLGRHHVATGAIR